MLFRPQRRAAVSLLATRSTNPSSSGLNRLLPIADPGVMSRFIILCGFLLGSSVCAVANANTPELAVKGGSASIPVATFFPQQRSQFMEARKALAEGDEARFDQLANGLTDYPLYRYLEYERLKSAFSDAADTSSIAELNQFEQSFGDVALTRKLTRQLQKQLIDQEDWSLFLALSKSRVAAKMDCAQTRARFETGVLKSFDETTRELWIKGDPDASLCEPVLSKLASVSSPGIPALWERIYTAIDKNRPDVARSMLGQLASGDRKRVKRWLDALEQPEKLLLSEHLRKDTVLNRRIIQDLVWRWSRADTAAAIGYWIEHRDQYAFYNDERYELDREMSLRAAYRRMPEAPGWLQSFTAREDDLELQEWRIRATLLAQDWPTVLKRIAELPIEEQEEDHWAYWVARAHESLGDVERAKSIYQELAELQSYHGFLAADRLKVPYTLYDEPIEVPATTVARLKQSPAMIRAREYHATELSWEGRREWAESLASYSPEEVAASAVLAADWSLYDRAVLSAGRAKARRALRYRFPVLYESQVLKAAEEMRIEPALIYGVMRRESGFIPDIRSGAGAVGLMQLMPRTAAYVADLKGEKNWNGDLTDENVNIDFGAYYIRHVLDRFDDHLVLALASYNAGPHRVKKWLPAATMPADVWIDTIPFTETRRYARAVLAYSLIFEWRLTGGATRLSQRLSDISPVDQLATSSQ